METLVKCTKEWELRNGTAAQIKMWIYYRKGRYYSLRAKAVQETPFGPSYWPIYRGGLDIGISRIIETTSRLSRKRLAQFEGNLEKYKTEIAKALEDGNSDLALNYIKL